MAHRIGVLGTGLMGERMITALDRFDPFEVVAAFDPDRPRLEALAARFGFSALGSEEELLSISDLDCIYIASPPKQHVPSASAALARGVPVYLEKPLSSSIAAAEQLVEIAESGSTPAAMHFPFSTHPALPRIVRELADGTAGTPLRVEVILHFSQWPRTWHHAGDWLRGSEEGGFLREVFSHFAYLTDVVCSPRGSAGTSAKHPRFAVETVARRDETPGGCETQVAATMRAGITPVSLVGGVGGAAPDFNRWTLYCTERSYRLEDWVRMSSSDGGEWSELESDLPDAADAWVGQIAAVDAWLRGDPHPLPSLRDGLEVARVVESLRRAPEARQ